jgi:hypothetical protein
MTQQPDDNFQVRSHVSHRCFMYMDPSGTGHRRKHDRLFCLEHVSIIRHGPSLNRSSIRARSWQQSHPSRSTHARALLWPTCPEKDLFSDMEMIGA